MDDLNFRLSRLADSSERWAFPTTVVREASTAAYQYPAVMVPEMQRSLLAELVAATGAGVVYDPFVGSGTTAAETMRLGLDFIGTDVNPLAVLLTKVRTGPQLLTAFRDATTRVAEAAACDRSRRFEIEMGNRRKWFRDDVTLQLSRLRRAIQQEPNLASRRFLWVALAETARLSSNARTSTIKLHARDVEDARSRAIEPRQTFQRVCAGALARAESFRRELVVAGYMERGYYSGSIEVLAHDATQPLLNPSGRRVPDVLLSSPPYGDNATTVAYGQQAYLPLQWIDLCDIGEGLAPINGIYEIDAHSLGGRTGKTRDEAEIAHASPALLGFLARLDTEPRERLTKTVAFYADLYASLREITETLAPGAVMAWTVGNRRVARRTVPLDAILSDFLESLGATPVTKLEREIPSHRKRMGFAESLSSETVCVFRTDSAALSRAA